MSAVSPLNVAQETKAQQKTFPKHMERLLKMGVNQNVVPLSPEFYRFTGSVGGALFLAQLLYWQPRTTNKGKWMFKTDAEWAAEICQSVYAVREARLRLEHMGIIETTVRRAMGSPTTHYRCDMARLEELWGQFLNTPADEWAQALGDFNDGLKAYKEDRRGSRKRPSA